MNIRLSRREFVAATASAGLYSVGRPSLAANRTRVALVGTGVRGTGFWGEYLHRNYADVVEFAALCDTNPGRLEYAQRRIGVDCPVFTDFDRMLRDVAIDLLIVCTVDATHEEFICKALRQDLDVVTEKPMVTDAASCQRVIDAAEGSRGRLAVGLNYRYGLLFSRLRELLMSERVGRITSVDFNWYLNVHHGASYFRRWHGLTKHSGSLLLHKSAHHFDLLNWWIGSEPVEVHAYGALEKYGANNPFRGERCMNCPHAGRCDFHWDMRNDAEMMALYHENERYDGYIRDNCLWRQEIDIYDKMTVQILYANDVQVSYSLTTYSPYEGFRVAFNGLLGRIETWEGVPSLTASQVDQAELHALEMDQHGNRHPELEVHEIVTQRNFREFERERLPYVRAGHWGGDKLMLDEMFRGENPNRRLRQAAGLRDGVLSVLVGIAARTSIEQGRPVRIEELTSLQPARPRG